MIIKNKRQYKTASKRIADLIDLDIVMFGAQQGKELEELVFAVSEYEKKLSPISIPDPIDAIKFKIDQLGLRQIDLVKIIGSASKVSEVLNKKRALNLRMIRNIHARLDIPLEVLVCEYDLDL